MLVFLLYGSEGRTDPTRGREGGREGGRVICTVLNKHLHCIFAAW